MMSAKKVAWLEAIELDFRTFTKSQFNDPDDVAKMCSSTKNSTDRTR